MEIILSKACESFTGSLGKGFGYYIRRRGNRFFGARSKHFVPPDGHWRFILACSQLAQIRLHITDIVVTRYEVQNAIQEAGWLHLIHAVDFKRTLNAADILAFKERVGL